MPFRASLPSVSGSKYYKVISIGSSNRKWPVFIGGSNSGGKCFSVEVAMSNTGVVAYGTKTHESASESGIKLHYVVGSDGCDLYVQLGSYCSVSILHFIRSVELTDEVVSSLPSGAVEVSIS